MEQATGGTRREIVSALTEEQQRLFSESQRVMHAFARQHSLSERELTALLAVMIAENRGDALTPTALARHIRLSSPATTSVINKLVSAGHVVRDRQSDDLRRVTLRYGDRAREVGEAFFGPLAGLTDAHADGFSLEELAVVHRYLSGMAAIMGDHAERLG